MTDLFITDVIAYYVRMGAQPVCFQVYAVKVGSVDAVLPRGTASACSLLLAVLCKAPGVSWIWAAVNWFLSPSPPPPHQTPRSAVRGRGKVLGTDRSVILGRLFGDLESQQSTCRHYPFLPALLDTGLLSSSGTSCCFRPPLQAGVH